MSQDTKGERLMATTVSIAEAQAKLADLIHRLALVRPPASLSGRSQCLEG